VEPPRSILNRKAGEGFGAVGKERSAHFAKRDLLKKQLDGRLGAAKHAQNLDPAQGSMGKGGEGQRRGGRAEL